jgi:hypothetical protein
MSGVKIRVKGDHGEITEITIARELVEAARALPHAPERYFEVANSVLFPLAGLINSRARPEGISNALKLMLSAYNGNQARRAPISIRRLDSENYLVLDGNSTAIVAVAAGWPVIPCWIAES